MSMRWSWLLAAALMATGCGKPATAVVVTIDAEPGVRLEASRLRLVVLGGVGRATAPAASRFDRLLTPGVDDDPAYPFNLALAPLDGDVGRSYSVTATAETATGTFVGQVRIIGGYVEGETLSVRLLLEDACRAVVCGDEQTCKAGACVDARTQGDVDAGMTDAGERDAGGVDAGTDAGATDAGTDGGELDASIDAAVDVDECIAATDDCDDAPAAVCTNTPGAFTCTCPFGFAGTGHGPTGCRWDDPSLAALVASAGSLSPVFASGTTTYTLTIPFSATNVTFTPTIAQPTRATITVDGARVASGVASGAIAVSPTPASLLIVVTTETGASQTYTVNVVKRVLTYVKASNANAGDYFGWSLALSSDGSTLAVGAFLEASNATGIDGNQADNSAADAGAVYVFTHTGSSWSQQAYLKASNSNGGDFFGASLALSSDGSTLAVGAYGEASNATGVDGNQVDNSANQAGAVYVFTRAGTVWTQQAYVKASNTDAIDQFGRTVSLSSDGATLAVDAPGERSMAAAIGGNQADNSAPWAGAVYVFSRAGSSWSQQAYIKASNTDANDYFGASLALSADGSLLAVGAQGEASNATGVGGDQTDNSASYAGAVYVFTRAGSSWTRQAYLKASNTNANDVFGYSLALSSDGSVLAVGANQEASNATGIGGAEANNSASLAGAVYVFTRAVSSWSQQAYVKASNTNAGDQFGVSVALSSDGSTLSVGAHNEASNATGIGGTEADNSASNAGAVYVFSRAGSAWLQRAYVKASNTNASDTFGYAVALSADGSALAVGAYQEDSIATGIGGNQADNSASGAGAVYVY